MYRLIIIYHVLFLILGSSLLSNTHFGHNHSHKEESHSNVECIECILIDKINDYTLSLDKFNYRNGVNSYLYINNATNLALGVQTFHSGRSPPLP